MSDKSSNKLIPLNELPSDLKEIMADFYTEDQMWEVTVSEKEISRLRRQLKASYGPYQHAAIMICKPHSCPYKETCPLISMKMAPEGDHCPIEDKKLDNLIKEYATDVAERFGVSPNDLDPIIRNHIMDLAYCDLIIARCNAQLARTGGVTESRVTHVIQRSGDMIREELPSELHAIIDRQLKQKHTIYKSLILTPEMTVKLKQKGSDEGAQQQSNIMDSVKAKVAQLKEEGSDSEIEISRETMTIKPGNKLKAIPKPMSYKRIPDPEEDK